jgi:TolB protein
VTVASSLRKLVVVGIDGSLNIVTTGTGGSASDSVDATLFARPEADMEIVAPVWSADGRWLAWTETDGVEGRIRVVEESSRNSLIDIPGFVAFCLDPSPDGHRLAHLASGPLGLELGVTDIDSGDTELVARGAPLYWSWSPDGQRLAIHNESELSIVGLGQGPERPEADRLVTDDSGKYLVPWWSPAGDEIIYVDGESRLVVLNLALWEAGGGEPAVLADDQEGYRFAVDPNGRRVAFVCRGEDGEAAVRVLDRLTGESVIAFDESVGGLWWCPDGRRLLALVRASTDAEASVRWAIWDHSDVVVGESFQMSSTLAATVLPFFEQFAPAHRLWSPDGRAVVTAGVSDGGRSEIIVQELDIPTSRVVVAQGTVAWWAPR